MKKIFTVLLVGFMVLTAVGSAFAAELSESTSRINRFQNAEQNMEQVRLNEERRNGRFDTVKELADEIHRMNELRMSYHELRAEVIEKNDYLLELYTAAKESGDTETLEAAKAIRQQVQSIHQEMRALHEQIKGARQELRVELKNGNTEGARDILNQIIDMKQAGIELMEEKIQLLEEMMDILS
ncbi:MAG: hypothetical protein ACOYVK_12710 [Bacillota bacterium]